MTLMLRFKLEDFESEGYAGDLSPGNQLKRAQRIYDQWVSEQVIVYGNCDEFEWSLLKRDEKDHIVIPSNFKNSTKTARIFDIKEIKKKPCNHEPRTWKESYYEDRLEFLDRHCIHCKKLLEPTGWKEV